MPDVAEARRLAEGYFEIGNAYWGWFKEYCPFLDTLGYSFRHGSACHTDYASPFATNVGFSQLERQYNGAGVRVQRELFGDGVVRWRDFLATMPRLRTVFCIGKVESMRTIGKALDTTFSEAFPFGWTSKRSQTHRENDVYVADWRPADRRIELYWWPEYNSRPFLEFTPDNLDRFSRAFRSHLPRPSPHP